MNNNPIKEFKPDTTEDTIVKNSKLTNQERMLKAFGKYIAENYLLEEGYVNKIPYKIVNYNRNKNTLNTTDYSSGFLSMFYNKDDTSTSVKQVKKSIDNLKENNYKLYESLLLFWDKEKIQKTCHNTTVYRRYNKAIFIIATDLGLLTDETQDLYKIILEKNIKNRMLS